MKTVFTLTFLLSSLFAGAQYTITTCAGNGTYGFSGDGNVATAAQLGQPYGVYTDASGNLFIADYDNSRIRKVSATSQEITTVAGNGIGLSNMGDGGQATDAQLSQPMDVCFDPDGNLLIACNYCIRKVDRTTGIITTIAGNPTVGGFSGEGGPATDALIARPFRLALFGNNLYFGIIGGTVEKIDLTTGILSRVAGTNTSGFSGDGGPASDAQIDFIGAVAVDAEGNLYIGSSSRIRKIDVGSMIIHTIAGSGAVGTEGDGGPAINANFYTPTDLSIDNAGNIYFVDLITNKVRKIEKSTSKIFTIAGTGETGYSGDGGIGYFATMNFPVGICCNKSGSTVYVAERYNFCIRKLYDSSLWVPSTKMTSALSVFPNPSLGTVSIGTAGYAPLVHRCNIVVTDLFGRWVHCAMSRSLPYSFDISSEPAGTYIIKVTSTEGGDEQVVMLQKK